MLDFLKNSNISDETIEYLINNLSGNEIMALIDNREECLKTIEIFKNIGINNIEEILINETYIFFKLSNRIINILSKYDINELANKVNDDYTYIEQIM